ncbi:hypothetical protein MJ579_28665 [Klebsiella pneumoniae]|nr:hypothetical protein MJ579_28665 [Klebsiella pneumoniae]
MGGGHAGTEAAIRSAYGSTKPCF